MQSSAQKLKVSPAPPGVVSVAHAKAHFSSLIAAVERKRNAVTVLRHGVPVAQIVPFPGAPRPSFLGSMAGTVQIHGDIISPIAEEWILRDWPQPSPDAGPDPDDD